MQHNLYGPAGNYSQRIIVVYKWLQVILPEGLLGTVLLICLGARLSWGTPVNEKLRQTESNHFIYIYCFNY